MTRSNTDSGLPRREPGRTMEVVGHQHPGMDDPNHKHRMGQIPHEHDEDGRPIINAEAKFTPAQPVAAAPSDDDTDPTLVTGNTEVHTPDSPDGPGEAAGMVHRTAAEQGTGAGLEAAPSHPSEVIPAPGGNFSNPTGAARNDLAYPRPDAAEAVLGAAMGVINPAAEPGYAITFHQAQARVLIVGQHVGNMFQASAEKQLPAADDIRAVYRLMRKMAASQGIDLDEVSG